MSSNNSSPEDQWSWEIYIFLIYRYRNDFENGEITISLFSVFSEKSFCLFIRMYFFSSVGFQHADSSHESSSRAYGPSRGVSTGQLRTARDSETAAVRSKSQKKKKKKGEKFPSTLRRNIPCGWVSSERGEVSRRRLNTQNQRKMSPQLRTNVAQSAGKTSTRRET